MFSMPRKYLPDWLSELIKEYGVHYMCVLKISCNQKRLKDKCEVVKELIEFKNSYLDRNLYREPHHIFNFFKFVKNRGEFREKTIKI